jgi:hypothetical protein
MMVDPTVVALILIALPLWVGLIVWVVRRERRPPS